VYYKNERYINTLTFTFFLPLLIERVYGKMGDALYELVSDKQMLTMIQ